MPDLGDGVFLLFAFVPAEETRPEDVGLRRVLDGLIPRRRLDGGDPAAKTSKRRTFVFCSETEFKPLAKEVEKKRKARDKIWDFDGTEKIIMAKRVHRKNVS